MRDYMALGPTPAAESCAQVGRDDYDGVSAMECKMFKEMLEAKFVNRPANTAFVVKSFPHDFGSYREVCIVFDDADEAATDFAYFVESNTPEYWHEVAPMDWRGDGD